MNILCPKRRGISYLISAVVGIGMFLAAPSALAQTATHSVRQFDGLLQLIQQSSEVWNARLLGYSEHLFWALALIQLVMTFGPLAVRGAEICEIVHELFKYVLVIGFFYELLTHATLLASALVQSFRDAGGIAIGQSSALQPGNVFRLAVQFADTIGNVTTINPLVAVSVSLASALVLLCFAFIAAFMAVTLIESYIVINASVLLLGFGGSQWTREYAMAMPRYAVAVGAKLFVLTLLVGLITQSASAWEHAYTHTDNASMWTMVGLSLVCAYLTKTIPDLIQGLIAGVSLGGGSTLGGMAAGIAGGTAAALGTVATGGIGGIAVGAGADLVGAAGGSAAGGSLASLIDSAVMGGSSAASGSSTSGAMGNPAVTSLSPRVGGAASAARPDKAANGVQPNRTASPSSGSTAASRAVHSAASWITRGAGVLASISVPGMESASGLSLGSPPPIPDSKPNGDDVPDTINFIQPAKETP